MEHNTPVTKTHIYVLLDRSGSMESIRNDVIGGFNRFLADQQADGADALLTLVQFDTENPADTIADAIPIREVVALTPATFVPRGGTPLFDATSRLIGRADTRASVLASVDAPPEDIVFVTITDGEENSSRETTLTDVVRRVDDRKKKGWTFVFLSAGLDAFGEAGGMGYDARSVRPFAASAAGATAAFSQLNDATLTRRSARRRGENIDTGDFFGDES
jgi:hypothetical protein